jgi:hypothetical protein
MESDRSLPLIEQAQELLRTEGIIAPALAHLERLVWIVLKAAEKRLFRLLTADLTNEWGKDSKAVHNTSGEVPGGETSPDVS